MSRLSLLRQRAALLWRGWPGLLLRCAMAVLPILWLWQRVDLRDIGRRAAALGPLPLLGSFAIYLVSLLFSSWRWRLLLAAAGAPALPPLLTLFRHNLESAWFNLLPSGVAGDFVRGHRLRNVLPQQRTSYLIVFAERLAGLTALLGLGSAAALIDAGQSALPSFFIAVMAGGAVAPLLVGTPAMARLGGPSGLRVWLLALAASVPVQIAVVVSAWLLAHALSPATTLSSCALVFPLIVLAVFFPLTPAGIGQREAAFVYFFAFTGMPAEVAVAISIASFGISLATAAVGGVVQLLQRQETTEPPNRSAR